MKLFLFASLACLLLVAGPVYAEPSLPSIDNRSITVLRPSPGISQLYDQRGNSATVYEVNPNMSWYSQRDKYGTIQSQGYVFDPLKEQPLRVPESMRYQPSPLRNPLSE